MQIAKIVYYIYIRPYFPKRVLNVDSNCHSSPSPDFFLLSLLWFRSRVLHSSFRRTRPSQCPPTAPGSLPARAPAQGDSPGRTVRRRGGDRTPTKEGDNVSWLPVMYYLTRTVNLDPSFPNAAFFAIAFPPQSCGSPNTLRLGAPLAPPGPAGIRRTFSSRATCRPSSARAPRRRGGGGGHTGHLPCIRHRRHG